MYNDIKPMLYKHFVAKSKDPKNAYRGTGGKAFPIGDRKYSYRHFRPNEDGSFSIYCMNLQKVENYLKGKTVTDTMKDWVNARHLATVYPDDTIEIRYAQSMGDRMMLGNLIRCHMSHSVRHGGTIVSSGRKVMHPIFQGVRLSLRGGVECKTPYVTLHPRVNRKKAAESMKQYDEFLNLWKVFLGQMTKEGIREITDDLDEEFHGHNFRKTNFDKLIQAKRYADAAMFIAIEMRNGWYLRYHADTNEIVHKIEKYLKEHFTDIIYKYGDEQIFDYTPVPMGNMFTSSKWKQIVTVDGKPVNRF
jgi:hypothetical protein